MIPSGRVRGAHVVFLTIACAVGVGAARAPIATAVMAVGITIVLAVALHPPLAAYGLLVATFLLGGIDRGVLIPLMRPQEALLLLVIVGLVAHLILAPTLGLRSHVRFIPNRVDLLLLLLAFTGSVLPLMWMLVRERPIEADDVFYALQLWKYLAVFLVFRASITTPTDVSRCLWVAMSGAVVLGAIGILQGLGLFGVPALMEAYFKPLDDSIASVRATSTLGSAFAVGDVMTFCLAIAAAWMVRGHPARLRLALLAAFFVIGAVASGQFSVVIGVVVAALVLGVLTRRIGRAVVSLAVVAIIAGLALQPVIDNRLEGFDTPSGLPRSWQGRLDNLETFFWPQIAADFNWVTGVRPAARVDAPESWREFVYIESGHTWLLWSGGVLFFVAYFAFLAAALTAMVRVARSRDDSVGVAATAAVTALAVTAVLMVLDVHLTLRGAAELSFALLALGFVGAAPRRLLSEERPPQAEPSRGAISAEARPRASL